MTRLQGLKIELSEYKRQMHICKPLNGCLGNQYIHWSAKYQETKELIESLKTSR